MVLAEFDEKELKSHIKGKNFYNLYLIAGDEDFLKRFYCDRLVSCSVEASMQDFNVDRLDSKTDINKIIDACELMPMMSEKRCVIVEDFKIESLKDDDLNRLRAWFADFPEFTMLIFYQKSDFSVAKAKKLLDLFKNFGAVCNINKRKGKALIKPLISTALKNKCILSEENANYLVSLCGDDYNVLTNEVNKLCHYAGQGEITRSAIDELATKTDDAKIYFLTKALLSKNFDSAYETLSSLLRQRTEPEYIMGTIISTYVDIYRAKVSLACSQNADALAGDFDYRNTAFRLNNAARDSRGMTVETIRKCLDELNAADRQLKFSRDSATVVFEQLMVKLFLISNGERV